MKHYLIKLLLIAAAVTIPACSSDDSKPETIECPLGYSGPNCETPITPTKIMITHVAIKTFPNTNQGEYWDFDSLPDIFFTINDDNFILYESSLFYPESISDEVNEYSFSLSTPYNITNLGATHYIMLWDYDAEDDIPSDDDVMCAGAFIPYLSSQGFPSTITITNTLAPFVCEVNLVYEW